MNKLSNNLQEIISPPPQESTRNLSSNSSFSLIPGILWPGVVVSIRAPPTD